MGIVETSLTSKNQTTVPAEVRKILNLSSKGKILWISMRPGEVTIVPAAPVSKKKTWADNLLGKYANNKVDGVKSLLDDRKEDLILEKRGFLKN